MWNNVRGPQAEPELASELRHGSELRVEAEHVGQNHSRLCQRQVCFRKDC